mmetsp:Transcript_31572/g.101336  ORF Transcript_31572/g.101336 Transcript_31572/m.101336 type:complete len:139 (+) Transcript_31572:2516-2932(+)
MFSRGVVGAPPSEPAPSETDEQPLTAVDAEFQAFLNLRRTSCPVQLPEVRKDGRDPLLGYYYDLPNFILLKLVVYCVLGGMASEANIERVFSVMGEIITPQRSTLDADKVEAMIYVTQNLNILSLEELIAATKAVMFN